MLGLKGRACSIVHSWFEFSCLATNSLHLFFFFCRSCRVAPLIQCDYCPLLFHMDCLEPPLTAMPLGRWMCPNHIEHVVVRTAASLQSSTGTAGAGTGSMESKAKSALYPSSLQRLISANHLLNSDYFDMPQLYILYFPTMPCFICIDRLNPLVPG